ncbi:MULTISPECIES: glutathione synthase [Azospirillaceae]|uniref:glutathione synthase n=1 Tax=Azospirillaceae TaxID=2829815 RepID=UPI000B67E53F|nr:MULTISPECIES: glutathione synthase [Azospirillaceae]MDG5497179.1 glutathione synthase [Niveispirillum sp. BGYR6]SNS57963.1 glutathione synthase [Azospirillum sp. RU38E]SNS77813.1 glutathione synthase [Azospirillum sp. RU37A]
MTLKVAIQMDPIQSINIDTDSTFMMALEAQRRGHALWHYHPRDLALRGNKLFARVAPVQVRRQKGDHFTLGASEIIELSTMDLVLMRQDPPFDMAYITATHLLEHIHPKTLVVNDPAAVRNAPEKLFVTHFPDLMPPTVITSSKEEVLAARAEWKDIIVKPLFGNGGAGVFHLKPEDENLGALLETFTQLYREPVIVQKYLPEIRQGDKRIILIDGKPAGAVSRIPQEGEARANFHAGGSAGKTELTKREQEICEAIGPTLRAQGLIFVGIDVIGDYLTEINVTSPTGIQEINRLNGSALESVLWDAMEARFAATRS